MCSTCTCALPVPPVVGPSGVVMVVKVVVRRQQVTNSEAIPVLQSHVRTQTITTGQGETGGWRQTGKHRVRGCGAEVSQVNLHVVSDEAP